MMFFDCKAAPLGRLCDSRRELWIVWQEQTALRRLRSSTTRFEAAWRVGVSCVTAGVAALCHRTRIDALRAVQAFTAFTPDNDPYGEHDFGFFKAAGHEFFWKIDYLRPVADATQ